MSYVLDALKKADAERERGAVPGLHAQPMPGVMDEAQPVRTLPAWVWLLAGATIVLLAALAWLLWTRDPATAPPPAAPSPASPPTLAQAPVPVTPHPTAPPPRAEPLRPPSAEANPQRSAQREPERTAVAAAERPQPVPSHTAPLAAKAAEPAMTAASAAPPAAAPKAEETPEGRIFAISELPEDVRRALPRLSVGGSIYSDNPASRFVIINGQVFHENDKLAPDLTLEQIRLKLAVLRYKDLRFRIMF